MRILGLILSIFVFVSCLNDKNSPLAYQPIVVDTTTAINPVLPVGSAVTSCSPDTVYFQQTILPLITSNCAMSGCHDAISHKEGVILTDYAHIRAYSSATNPTGSSLYKSVVNGYMPPKTPWNSTQKATLLKWMQQGAKNNSCVATAVNCDTTGVSFSATVFPTLKTYCTGCHSGNSPSGSIDLSSYTNVTKYISNGKLYGSIAHSTGFIPMPSASASLSACEISQIKSWIDAGSKNN